MRNYAAIAKFGNALGEFKDYPRAVGCWGSGRIALVHDPRIRPVGYPRATATTDVVAHDVAPFRAVNVPVTIGKWRVGKIDKAVVPDAENVTYLVRYRHGDRGTRVMYHKKGFIRIWTDARGQTAAGGIVDDQTDDCRTLLVAEFPYVLKRTNPINHCVKMIELITDTGIVVDQLTMYEPQANVAKAAISECFIGFVDT